MNSTDSTDYDSGSLKENWAAPIDWKRQQIDFTYTHTYQADDVATTMPLIQFVVQWTQAGWPWKPFVVVQIGRHHFQIGWLY